MGLRVTALSQIPRGSRGKSQAPRIRVARDGAPPRRVLSHRSARIPWQSGRNDAPSLRVTGRRLGPRGGPRSCPRFHALSPSIPARWRWKPARDRSRPVRLRARSRGGLRCPERLARQPPPPARDRSRPECRGPSRWGLRWPWALRGCDGTAAAAPAHPRGTGSSCACADPVRGHDCASCGSPRSTPAAYPRPRRRGRTTPGTPYNAGARASDASWSRRSPEIPAATRQPGRTASRAPVSLHRGPPVPGPPARGAAVTSDCRRSPVTVIGDPRYGDHRQSQHDQRPPACGSPRMRSRRCPPTPRARAGAGARSTGTAPRRARSSRAPGCG